MPAVYSRKEKEMISLLMRRMYKKCMESGITYRQVGVMVKATAGTVHRWFHAKDNAWPSRHHVHHIKKFLGYIDA